MTVSKVSLSIGALILVTAGSNPIAAATDSKWSTSAQASGEQISAATSDVQCKVKTNLVGVGMAIQSAYDQIYITTHFATLNAYESNLADYVRKHASA